jgi:hypothetical protein
MNKKEIVYANAMAEAHEAHEFGHDYSRIMTSYKCPKCRRINLTAEVYINNVAGYTFDIEVNCQLCKKNHHFSI